jgi:hypothetical protein
MNSEYRQEGNAVQLSQGEISPMQSSDKLDSKVRATGPVVPRALVVRLLLIGFRGWLTRISRNLVLMSVALGSATGPLKSLMVLR